jgi:hypothetical protein
MEVPFHQSLRTGIKSQSKGDMPARIGRDDVWFMIML